jgi:hypothetical protein
MNAMIFMFGIEQANIRLDNFYRLRGLLGKLKLIDERRKFYDKFTGREI